MLNEKQCIEVAEKVWGWEKRQSIAPYPHLKGRYFWFNEDSTYALREIEIKGEVNSWRGFGRTVEAMADRTHCAFYGKLKAHLAQYFMDESKEKLNGLFEMVHLAALEAMKND